MGFLGSQRGWAWEEPKHKFGGEDRTSWGETYPAGLYADEPLICIPLPAELSVLVLRQSHSGVERELRAICTQHSLCYACESIAIIATPLLGV